MIPRYLKARILTALADNPVVFLQGARQTGKSTLVQSIARSDFKADYLTLDDAAVLASAQLDPEGFIAGIKGPVIIDEVQRVPELFLAIKAEVDREREPGRFLLTGSANARVIPMLSEALVGRVEILSLWPFSQDEIEQTKMSIIDSMFKRGKLSPKKVSLDENGILQRLHRGGFPEAVRRRTQERRRAWFGSYVTTILQRDVRDMASIEGLTELPRLLALLAARSSSLMNYAELSRSSGIPQTTLKRYLSLLEATFLLQSTPPWKTNLSKRVVKAPKLMLSDTGLITSLLGVNLARLKSDPLLTGQLLETFVAMELQKQASWSSTQPRLFHYRSHSQGEVDIVLEEPGGCVVGIEVKSATSIDKRDLRGLYELEQMAGGTYVRGIVFYQGHQIVPFSQKCHGVPIACLWHGF